MLNITIIPFSLSDIKYHHIFPFTIIARTASQRHTKHVFLTRHTTNKLESNKILTMDRQTDKANDETRSQDADVVVVVSYTSDQMIVWGT